MSLRTGKGSLSIKTTPAKLRALTQKSRIKRLENKHYSSKTYSDTVPF